MDDKRIDRLIRQIYDAALDDALWQETFNELSSEVFYAAVGFDHNSWLCGADPFCVCHDIDPVLRDCAIYEYNTVPLQAP